MPARVDSFLRKPPERRLAELPDDHEPTDYEESVTYLGGTLDVFTARREEDTLDGEIEDDE